MRSLLKWLWENTFRPALKCLYIVTLFILFIAIVICWMGCLFYLIDQQSPWWALVSIPMFLIGVTLNSISEDE
jgi:hypothetical protein